MHCVCGGVCCVYLCAIKHLYESYQLETFGFVHLCWVSSIIYLLMQPSMGTLNSPSSRVIKDLMPTRCHILRCINFGIGESSPNLFFNILNLGEDLRWVGSRCPLMCALWEGVAGFSSITSTTLASAFPFGKSWIHPCQGSSKLTGWSQFSFTCQDCATFKTCSVLILASAF